MLTTVEKRATEFYWNHVKNMDYAPKSEREMIAMLVAYDEELKHRLSVHLAAIEKFKSRESAKELLDQI